jgi:hypothetical protein
MKPRGPTAGSGPVVCAMSGVVCWLVKAQFSGTLFVISHQPEVFFAKLRVKGEEGRADRAVKHTSPWDNAASSTDCKHTHALPQTPSSPYPPTPAHQAPSPSAHPCSAVPAYHCRVVQPCHTLRD